MNLEEVKYLRTPLETLVYLTGIMQTLHKEKQVFSNVICPQSEENLRNHSNKEKI
jgi:hypothetical protein